MKPNGTNGYQKPDGRKLKQWYVCSKCNSNFKSDTGKCSCGNMGVTQDALRVQEQLKLSPKFMKPVKNHLGNDLKPRAKAKPVRIHPNDFKRKK